MTFITGNINHDIASYNSQLDEPEAMHQCAYSEDNYYESEMVYDGYVWVAKRFVYAWLNYLKDSIEDFDNYKLILTKQL